MENPTYEKVLEGAKQAREKEVDFILAVGGGSVADCCKAVSMAVFIKELGHPVTLRDIGAGENTDLRQIADSCILSPGSYKKMTHREILEILQECY